MVLDGEIIVEKINGLRAIGEDATDFCGGDDNVFRPLTAVEFADSGGIKEVEFGTGFADEVRVAERGEATPDGAANQAAMSRDIDAGAGCNCHAQDNRAAPAGQTSR
jgi:hypothetical protein